MTNDTMSDYIRSLTTCGIQPDPSETITVEQQWRDSNRPLVARLRDLLATIPIEVQRAGLPLRDLQPRLKGRKGKMCDHAELGAALRSLGFRRDRRWSQPDQGFRAVWKLEV
jgi:hypothetical protein